jgi:hypothetical protein
MRTEHLFNDGTKLFELVVHQDRNELTEWHFCCEDLEELKELLDLFSSNSFLLALIELCLDLLDLITNLAGLLVFCVLDEIILLHLQAGDLLFESSYLC